MNTKDSKQKKYVYIPVAYFIITAVTLIKGKLEVYAIDIFNIYIYYIYMHWIPKVTAGHRVIVRTSCMIYTQKKSAKIRESIYQYGLTLNREWTSKHKPSKARDIITSWSSTDASFYPRPVWPSSVVVACVCVSVCVSVCLVVYQSLVYLCYNPFKLEVKLYPILSFKFGRAIFHRPFKLRSPTLEGGKHLG